MLGLLAAGIRRASDGMAHFATLLPLPAPDSFGDTSPFYSFCPGMYVLWVRLKIIVKLETMHDPYLPTILMSSLPMICKRIV